MQDHGKRAVYLGHLTVTGIHDDDVRVVSVCSMSPSTVGKASEPEMLRAEPGHDEQHSFRHCGIQLYYMGMDC